MDPTKVFCHNLNCPARGTLGHGNIGVHSIKQSRYICHVCGKTFTDTKDSMFYRLRHSAEFVTLIVTLLAYGCPIAAIVAAFGLDERTVPIGNVVPGFTVRRFISIWCNNPVTWDRFRQMRYVSNIKVA